MQLQQRLLELFSKKIKSKFSDISAKKNDKTSGMNTDILDAVIREQVERLNDSVMKGIEKEKNISLDFVNWVIIEYNLRSSAKVSAESGEILKEVILRMKKLGIRYNEVELDKQIIYRTNSKK